MITYMTHDVLTAVTKVDEVTVGSVWVYQRDRIAAIERVTVTAKLAVDIQPPRITILHMSGATENVPASRLKTLWENLPAYTEAVERWAELRATVPSSQGRLGAAQAVFDELLPIDSAEIADQADGALSIHDMDAVCAQTGLRPDGLNMFPGTFYELGSIYAPWAAVNLLAARLAEQNPEVILRLALAAEKGGIRCREEYFEDWGRDYWEQARQLRAWYKEPAVTVEQENTVLKARLETVEADLLTAMSIARQAIDLVSGRRAAAAVDRLTLQLTAITGVESRGR